MTYCLAIKVREGLICLADGRVTAGSQVSSARKVSLHGIGGEQICIMTSGLRSVRDKTIAYFERHCRNLKSSYVTIYDALEAYSRNLRKVAELDRDSLKESGLEFNLHTIFCGQLSEDPEPHVFLVYPEGNWVEVAERAPYISIGATAYGKPILDRALRYDTPLSDALSIAYISFDSTRVSTADVGYPLDILTYGRDRQWREMLFDYDDMREWREWWNTHVKELLEQMPPGPWRHGLLPPEPEDQRFQVVSDDQAG